jgi:hypothetical protein
LILNIINLGSRRLRVEFQRLRNEEDRQYNTEEFPGVFEGVRSIRNAVRDKTLRIIVFLN